jgi:NAD(P)H-flavin reductase
VGPAKGVFVLDEADRRTRIFVGTGTGLAPLLAMLARLSEAGDRSPNVLVHGAAFQSELAYREQIESWVAGGLDLWYIPSVSRPDDAANTAWTGTTGRVHSVMERVLDADPSLCGGRAYLCGHPAMLEQVRATLVAGGMREGDVETERFVAPAAMAPPAAANLAAAA